MKKILLLLSTVFCLGAIAQSSIQLTLHSNGYTLTPNEIINVKTKADGTSIVEVDITNIGNTTKQYKVRRTDIVLNTNAIAYFCYAGNCYTENTLISPDADTLAPGQSASELQGDFKLLSADLIEGSVVGLSEIQYKFYDVDNTSDSFIFTLRYNGSAATGIKESFKTLNNVEIFPNPANENVAVSVHSVKAMTSQVNVINALGEVVIQKDVKLIEGKNTVDLDIEKLNSGVYFVLIKSGNDQLSKKLIIQ